MHIHLFRGTGAKNVVCLAPMGGNTMRTRRVIIFATLLVFTLGSFVLSAQHPEPKKRIALVVGNDAYGGSNDNPKQLTKLINPVRDARAVAALLKQYGFNVIEGYDLDRDRFARLIALYSRETTGVDTALIFYAGHGMEVVEKDDLINTLAPIDAEIDCETREHFNTIKLEDLTKAARGAKNQIVILDACRNNPFPRCPAKRGNQSRGYGF